MSDPKVSVLMSVLNGRAFLDEAVDSILNQTLGDFELIVVDDGSTDGTWDALDRFAKGDGRIVTLRNETNLGTSRALNAGLIKARGRYITRQDADDASVPVRLEKQVAFLEANPAVGAVATAVWMVNEEGAPIRISTSPSEDPAIQAALLDYMCFCGPTVMVRRDCWEGAGFFFDEDMSFSEDYDLCLRLAEVTRMASIEEPLYRYRQHSGSVSHSQRYRQVYRKAMALERAIHRRHGPVPSIDQRVYIARDFLRAAVLGYASNELQGARHCLGLALAANPNVLEADQPAEETITRYAPSHSTGAALAFTEGVFVDLFPRNRRLARLKARLLSRLHMNEVFTGVRLNEPGRVHAHLWAGIRHDPTWLLKRGVFSILLRDPMRTLFRNATRAWNR